MLKRYKVSMRDKARCPHILALRLFPTEKYCQVRDWDTIAATIAHMRGEKFTWMPSVHARPTGGSVEWLAATPGLQEWIKSEDCLRSPTKWPKPVYKAFKYRLIPSPHQIANVDMNHRHASSERSLKHFLVVLLYCMGVPIPAIAEAQETSEREIIQIMYHGIESLQPNPNYLIWASGTDFRKSVFPPFVMRIPMRARMRFLAALQSNPFLADYTFAQKLVQSPPYLSYLIYGSPKRMRLTKGCRMYRSGEQNGA